MSIRKAIRTAAAVLALCLLPAAALAGTYEVSQKLREDMPPFRFSLAYDHQNYSRAEAEQRDYTQEGDFFYIHTISIFREDDRSTVQQITLNPPSETFDDETLGLVLEDMNFDGFFDLRVMQYVSGGTNIPYFCYLWDPASWQFVYSEALSAIPSPTFDAISKVVHGSEYINSELTEVTKYIDTSTAYVDTTYAFNGSALIPIGRLTTGYDYATGVSIITVEELVDGQLTVTEVRRERFLEETQPPTATEEPYRFTN